MGRRPRLGGTGLPVPGVAKDANNDPEAFDGTKLNKDCQSRQSSASTLYYVGMATTGIGSAAAVVGFTVKLRGGGRLAPTLVDGGLGINLRR